MLKEMLLMNMNLSKKLVVAVIHYADYVFIKLLVLNMQLRYLPTIVIVHFVVKFGNYLLLMN